MSGLVRDLVPTRSMLLELRRERQFVIEGFELLDQKRILLATETLRWLGLYEELDRGLGDALGLAISSLAEATALHGVRELARSPAPARSPRVDAELSRFLGLSLVQTTTKWAQETPDPGEPRRTPEWRRCQKRFSELVERLTQIAGVASNLERLVAEYQRNERKARALEDVILPELQDAVDRVADHIEAEEQEEAIRVRTRRESSGNVR